MKKVFAKTFVALIIILIGCGKEDSNVKDELSDFPIVSSTYFESMNKKTAINIEEDDESNKEIFLSDRIKDFFKSHRNAILIALPTITGLLGTYYLVSKSIAPESIIEKASIFNKSDDYIIVPEKEAYIPNTDDYGPLDCLLYHIYIKYLDIMIYLYNK